MKYADIALRQCQSLLDLSPFVRFLGVKVLAADVHAGEFQFSVDYREDFDRTQDAGHVHGGVIAAVADTAAGAALAMTLGHAVPTVSLHLDYLRPVANSGLSARVRVRRVGVAVGTVDVELSDDGYTLAALARGTFATGGAGQ